jgi:hypothetical protein
VIIMNIYALICTRNKAGTPTRNALTSYLSRLGVQVKLLVGQKSIFEAYTKTVNNIDYSDEDIFIFCHDDIEVLNDPTTFMKELVTKTGDHEVGFVGVAGTQELGMNAVWWDRALLDKKVLRGCVFHGDSRDNMAPSHYGKPLDEVLCMDGLFLACRGNVLRKLDLTKPDQFSGEWDYYDIYYTLQARELGFKNKVIPILLRHESFGDLAGRESWHKNRAVIQKMYKLPLTT